jgi:hypothetical protein
VIEAIFHLHTALHTATLTMFGRTPAPAQLISCRKRRIESWCFPPFHQHFLPNKRGAAGDGAFELTTPAAPPNSEEGTAMRNDFDYIDALLFAALIWLPTGFIAAGFLNATAKVDFSFYSERECRSMIAFGLIGGPGVLLASLVISGVGTTGWSISCKKGERLIMGHAKS